MFRPMLAPNKDPMGYAPFFEEIKYPLLVSPKLDGIRAANKDGWMMSRTMKPLPNDMMQDIFAPLTKDLDGELIEGVATDIDVYNRTQSVVMSRDKDATNLTYHVFDYCAEDWLDKPFSERYEEAKKRVAAIRERLSVVHVKLVPHKIVNNLEELLAFEAECLQEGYEGIMARSTTGKYKTNARCTWKEMIIFKLKRFKDEEAKIVGFVERMHNTNEAFENELGRSTRRDTKDAKQPMGMVGKFLVEWEGEQIEVAPGNFKHDELTFVWDHRTKFMGKILKFRHFAHGVKDKPRFPRAVGFRDEMDM